MIGFMLLLIFIAGAVGGAVNALMTDNGFIFPRSEESAEGVKILRPGVFGNMVTGGVAAMISWGLYGPMSAIIILPAQSASSTVADGTGLSLASLVGALLVGVGGARWLSNEVDKNLLRAAASDAAGKDASDATSKKMAFAKPAEALQLAKTI